MAITGAYAKKRKLFTDNQQVIMHIQSKLMINGIGDLIKKTDLAERSCVIYPDIIKPFDRLTEKDGTSSMKRSLAFWVQFLMLLLADYVTTQKLKVK